MSRVCGRVTVPLRTHGADPPPPDAAEEQEETRPEQVACHVGITWASSPSREIKTSPSVQRRDSLVARRASVLVRLPPARSPDVCKMCTKMCATDANCSLNLFNFIIFIYSKK